MRLADNDKSVGCAMLFDGTINQIDAVEMPAFLEALDVLSRRPVINDVLTAYVTDHSGAVVWTHPNYDGDKGLAA